MQVRLYGRPDFPTTDSKNRKEEIKRGGNLEEDKDFIS